MSFLSELQAAHNNDIAKASQKKGRFFTPTGHYTATATAVEGAVLKPSGANGLNITLELVDENGRRKGRVWLDVTPTELEGFNGKRRRETQLYYDLFALSGAEDVEEFVALIENGMLTFSLYGKEYFEAPVDKLPIDLVDERHIDEDGAFVNTRNGKMPWQKVFVEADDEELRDRLLDAGQRSRLMVLRVNKVKA